MKREGDKGKRGKEKGKGKGNEKGQGKGTENSKNGKGV